MTQLAVGDEAPAFSLPNQDGRLISLADFADTRVVIWFFSRAFGSN